MIKYVLLFLTTASATVIPRSVDPCTFLGLRFVRVVSTCDESTSLCRGLFMGQDRSGYHLHTNGGEPITCAFATMESELKVAKLSIRTVEEPIQIPDVLQRVIVPALRRVVFGAAVTNTFVHFQEAFEKMVAIDHYLLSFLLASNEQ